MHISHFSRKLKNMIGIIAIVFLLCSCITGSDVRKSEIIKLGIGRTITELIHEYDSKNNNASKINKGNFSYELKESRDKRVLRIKAFIHTYPKCEICFIASSNDVIETYVTNGLCGSGQN